MIRLELALGLVTLALWIYCLVDVISRGAGEVRNLPKTGWILLVLFFPLAGSVAYLVAGRPQGEQRRPRHERAVPGFPEYDRPGRASATNPEDDEEFLRKVRERAEEQRRRHREAELERAREEQAKLERRLQRDRPEEPETGA